MVSLVRLLLHSFVIRVKDPELFDPLAMDSSAGHWVELACCGSGWVCVNVDGGELRFLEDGLDARLLAQPVWRPAVCRGVCALQTLSCCGPLRPGQGPNEGPGKTNRTQP